MRELSVLIVGEDRGGRAVARQALSCTKRRLRVHEAAGLDEALATYFRERIDVVLASIALPSTLGFDLLRTLRRQDPHVFCVFTCDTARQGVVLHAMRLGAAAFLLRPFSTAKIDRLLKIRADEGAKDERSPGARGQALDTVWHEPAEP